MRIVLDTNILLVAIGKKSRYRPIWDAFINGNYLLIVSEDIVFEYHEVLQLHGAEGAAEIIMEILNRPMLYISMYIITGAQLKKIPMIISFLI